MAKRIEQAFPRLRGDTYQVTSQQDDSYNCIAWAAGDAANWWWPDEPDNAESSYWPPGVARTETLEAFCQAFTTIGYAICDNCEHEMGHEKIALFAVENVPKHAGRQLPNGRWTSKLGPMEDIEHFLHDLADAEYGSVALVMKRPFAGSGI